jgi:hypothetical protein
LGVASGTVHWLTSERYREWHRQYIRKRRRTAGMVERSVLSAQTAERRATAQKLLIEGLLFWEIAERLGVSQSTVSRWLHGVPKPPEPRDKRRPIITPHGRFESAGAAGKAFGISRQAASHRATCESQGWRFE